MEEGKVWDGRGEDARFVKRVKLNSLEVNYLPTTSVKDFGLKKRELRERTRLRSNKKAI